MEAYIADWLNVFGRWLHFIAGIAWIGSSFYFVWLDDHLEPVKDPQDSKKGVGGEIWSVHGGGFYHAQKYRVSPQSLPETLHWFKWEAYTTWLSGMFLLALVYWYGAEVYLIDPGVAEMSQWQAVGAGAAILAVGWVVYDLLCKSALGRNDVALGAVVSLLTVFAAWGMCELFSGRGAFIHFGAMLGTIMVANVFFVIIPGQKELVAATREGRPPDPTPGLEAKQRSVHNTYFTLPVLFVMISNHYAVTYGHPYNWLILVAISIAGALIRVYFVARHKGNASPLPLAGAAVLLLAVMVALAPRPSAEAGSAATSGAAVFAEVERIIETRCVTCHSETPTHVSFPAPPLGVVFDTREQILVQSTQIHQQTVVTRTMPIGNLTAISEEERAVLDTWFKAGAATGSSP